MMYGCQTGVLACATPLVWLVPGTALALASRLGCSASSSGRIFPTTMALRPGQWRCKGCQSTAIGVMNAASTVGCLGAALAGGRHRPGRRGWTLLPYAMALAALQFVVWRPLATWIRRANAAGG